MAKVLNMRVVFDLSTLRQSKIGSVTGVVYFDFEARQQFPVVGWNDFVVVIADWWIAALDQIADGQSEVDLRFMDGPYWIRVAVRENAQVLLRCMGDRGGVHVVHETTVKLPDLREELMGFGHAVLQACSREGITTPDLEHLRKRLLN